METAETLCVIRGGGDLATGVAFRLRQAGFPVLILELPRPLVVRRRVALASAVLEGEVIVDGLTARLVDDLALALDLARLDIVPVLVAPEWPDWPPMLEAAGHSAVGGRPSVPVLIDARMAKRNIDTTLDQAGLVIGLGPGFTAGTDCHAVVETMRGHHLGRVIWQGAALPNTGTPGIVAGYAGERVLRAPVAGEVIWDKDIGDRVAEGAVVGRVAGETVIAPFPGVLRGLIAPGTHVPAGLKIGDLDARGDPAACFTISDKALAIGGGVLAAVLSWIRDLNTPRRLPSLSLPAALGLRGAGELVALVGGGGKSTLLFELAKTLTGRTIITTTTRIFAAQMARAPVVFSGLPEPKPVPKSGQDDWALALDRFGVCLVVGQVEGEKAFGVEAHLPGRWLAREGVDAVLVEADGSRMRPCKAPAAHEPVIPPEATLVVPVAGIDALEGSLAEVAHRPERVSALTGLSLDERLTPESLAGLIVHPEGGLKGIPPRARVVPFINKVETNDRLIQARRIARQALAEPRVEKVVLGALRTSRPVREIHCRVTAVVLAAGRSERMGLTKQLLPWGQTTVLGQTLANVAATAVHNVLVVTGHEAEAVAAVAEEFGFPTIHNPAYAVREMLSSLQVALRTLPSGPGAVLVVLADQPMVEPAVMDELLFAYWQSKGRLIAPSFQGKRGNPVLIDRRYYAELHSLVSGAPRDVLRRHADELHLVVVESDSVLQDLDLPADYERFRPSRP